MTKVLFEDKWCEVTTEELIIKCYYFPTGTSKKIKKEKIRAVYYEVQGAAGQMCKTKGWGMSLSPCWWACDLRRNWHSSSDPEHYNVVIDCGETLYKGFTVIDICTFRSQLQSIAPEAVFLNELPF
ncbi:hypothetical protein OESDEN_07690 [Oesophagostomum dentatum]|uniref:Uncharacterized protein n=1 Tax=Oesophagostomum dentatum TaxID=61180 RepID=A0A0B1T5A2_OESDE|nr:hypothetical protein OESDEN_07690 [Oesophagostomum dentatum]